MTYDRRARVLVDSAAFMASGLSLVTISNALLVVGHLQVKDVEIITEIGGPETGHGLGALDQREGRPYNWKLRCLQ